MGVPARVDKRATWQTKVCFSSALFYHFYWWSRGWMSQWSKSTLPFTVLPAKANDVPVCLIQRIQAQEKDMKARGPRRFRTSPGRTTAWWVYFVAGVVVEEEWKENLQGAMTIYYLSGEGRVWTTVNAFGVTRETDSIVIRRVTRAIAKFLGLKYISLPFAEDAIDNKVNFQ